MQLVAGGTAARENPQYLKIAIRRRNPLNEELPRTPVGRLIFSR